MVETYSGKILEGHFPVGHLTGESSLRTWEVEELVIKVGKDCWCSELRTLQLWLLLASRELTGSRELVKGIKGHLGFGAEQLEVSFCLLVSRERWCLPLRPCSFW